MTAARTFDLSFLTGATRGIPVGDPGGERVVTDSRADVAGALFVALTGPNFDGHDFVAPVLAAGAAGAVVSASWWGRAGRGRVTDVLVVPDTLLALQDLARAHRVRHPVPLAAVTGSNGKTTTKELLAAALAPLGPVLKTAGNLNNHIGVPLTLLGLRGSHRAAAVEIGLNRPGELSLLSGLARPRAAIITNVAAAHLEGLGSVDGVARAKSEIVDGLEPGGVLVVPHGDPHLERALAGYAGPRVTFGLDPAADLHPERLEPAPGGGTRVVLPGGTAVDLRLAGAHNVRNLLAAVAAARGLGVAPADAAPHLAGVEPVAGRLQPRAAAGVTVIDDSYNANPGSLAASLAVLRERPERGRRFAILADMLELGPDTAALHREAGRNAAFLDGLVTVGEMGRELAAGAVEAGLEAGKAREAADGEAAGALLLPDLAPGDVVLVKGSRGMHLESAVAGLLAGLEGRG